MKNVNYLRRVKHVCEIVNQHYEPGNYSKSYKKVWLQYVYPVYPMCYRTLLNYLGVAVPKSLSYNHQQLSLF